MKICSFVRFTTLLPKAWHWPWTRERVCRFTAMDSGSNIDRGSDFVWSVMTLAMFFLFLPNQTRHDDTSQHVDNPQYDDDWWCSSAWWQFSVLIVMTLLSLTTLLPRYEDGVLVIPKALVKSPISAYENTLEVLSKRKCQCWTNCEPLPYRWKVWPP